MAMAMEGISLSKREAEESSGFEEEAKRIRMKEDFNPVNFPPTMPPPDCYLVGKGIYSFCSRENNPSDLSYYPPPWQFTHYRNPDKKILPCTPTYTPSVPLYEPLGRQPVCYGIPDKNLPPRERYTSLKKAKSEIDLALKEMEKERGIVVKSCASKHNFMFREDGNFLLDLSSHLVHLRMGAMVDLNNFVWCEGPYIGEFHWTRCARWFHINFNAKFQSDHQDDSTFEQFYFAEMIEFRCENKPRKYKVISCVPLDRNANVPGENSPYKCVICDCNQVHHPSSDFCIADKASMDPKDFEEWIQAGIEVK